MNVEQFREYCIAKPYVSESFPFNETVLVFKVCDKMFALADIEDFDNINLKCDPEVAIELRSKHSEVVGAFHMNKTHWNSVSTKGNLSEKLIKTMIDDSYALVYNKLPKRIRDGHRAEKGK